MREVRPEDEARRMTVPKHVPNILRRSQVAKVLGLKSEQVAYMTRRGDIPTVGAQFRYTGWWYEYAPQDIAEFAESRKIVPNWSALKE